MLTCFVLYHFASTAVQLWVGFVYTATNILVRGHILKIHDAIVWPVRCRNVYGRGTHAGNASSNCADVKTIDQAWPLHGLEAINSIPNADATAAFVRQPTSYFYSSVSLCCEIEHPRHRTRVAAAGRPVVAAAANAGTTLACRSILNAYPIPPALPTHLFVGHRVYDMHRSNVALARLSSAGAFQWHHQILRHEGCSVPGFSAVQQYTQKSAFSATFVRYYLTYYYLTWLYC